MMISKKQKPRILIVEDNEIFSEYFLQIFGAKFDVRNEFSAEDAIFSLQEFSPDLIWLDILLGNHSAFAFLNEIRTYADTAKIPVVICSDLAENLGQENLREYGVARIFDKSKMTPREILTEVERILNEAN